MNTITFDDHQTLVDEVKKRWRVYGVSSFGLINNVTIETNRKDTDAIKQYLLRHYENVNVFVNRDTWRHAHVCVMIGKTDA